MVAMIGMESQKRAFSDRLVRIAAGGENTTRHVYIGPVEEASRGKRRWRKAPGLMTSRRPSRLVELVMLAFALAFGAAMVVAGRVFEFHVVTESLVAAAGSAGPYLEFTNLVVGFLLALILGRIFRVWSGLRGRALVAGFLGMLLFEGLAIVRYPEVFAQIYSADYVAAVMAKLAA